MSWVRVPPEQFFGVGVVHCVALLSRYYMHVYTGGSKGHFVITHLIILIYLTYGKGSIVDMYEQ